MWKSVKPWSHDRLIAAGAYPGFCSIKRLGEILLPLHGMLVQGRSLPHDLLWFPNNSLVAIYIPGWGEALWEFSVLPKNTTMSLPRAGTRTERESSALTMRPPFLPLRQNYAFFNFLATVCVEFYKLSCIYEIKDQITTRPLSKVWEFRAGVFLCASKCKDQTEEISTQIKNKWIRTSF